MSELLREMTRAEKTRNEIEAAHDDVQKLAEGLSAAAWVAYSAEDPNQRCRPELQCVLRHALYQLGEMADALDANLEKVAAMYANERTITECAHAIADREGLA